MQAVPDVSGAAGGSLSIAASPTAPPGRRCSCRGELAPRTASAPPPASGTGLPPGWLMTLLLPVRCSSRWSREPASPSHLRPVRAAARTSQVGRGAGSLPPATSGTLPERSARLERRVQGTASTCTKPGTPIPLWRRLDPDQYAGARAGPAGSRAAPATGSQHLVEMRPVGCGASRSAWARPVAG